MSLEFGSLAWLEEQNRKVEAWKREERQKDLEFFSECCRRDQWHDMERRLARAATDGFWDDDNVAPDNENTDASTRRESVLESNERFCAVLVQLVDFFSGKDEILMASLCARKAGRQDLVQETPPVSRAPPASSEWAHSGEEGQGSAAQSEDEHDDAIVHSDEREGDISSRGHRQEDDRGRSSRVRRVSPIIDELLARMATWPAGGFADDDPATGFMVEILGFFRRRYVARLTADEFAVVPTANKEERTLRPYQQAMQYREDGSDVNFWFEDPEHPGQMMGKVDLSKVGLSIIVQALRAVVNNYEDVRSITPLGRHVERLHEANGAMEWVRHREDEQTCFVFADPYTPEGARSALSALQAAVRYSQPGRVLFYTVPVDERTREGKLGALLDVHPIIGHDF